MSTDEYVPSDEDVKIAWADRRLFLDSLSDGNPSPDAIYDAEFDRFLAGVRRDAARDLVDALCREGVTGKQITFLSDYMSAHYPEETDR